MPGGSLIGRGFVRIDADTAPAKKAMMALGAIGSQAGVGVLSTLIGPITAATMALASSFAVAGAAGGAFAAAVVPQFKDIAKAQQQKAVAEDQATKASTATTFAQEAARKGGFKYGQQVKITSKMTSAAKERAVEYNKALTAAQSATKASAQSQELYKSKLKALPPATRDTADAMQRLKDDTNAWSRSLSSSTMPLFTQGIDLLRGLLPKLTPVVKESAVVIGNFMYSLGEGQAGKTFREFGRNVTKNGAGALENLLNIIKNVVVGFVGVLNAFMPASKGVSGGLEDMTAKFASFGAGLGKSEGFQQWMQTMKERAPGIMQTLKDLVKTVLTVISSLGPLAGLSLKTAEVFAQLIAAIPTPVLKLLAQAIVITNVAMKLYAIYTAIASGVTWAFSASTGASRASMLLLRIGMAAYWVQLRLMSAWTAISTAATWAFSAAMAVATSPITLVVLAIVALVAAIVWIAVKTTWFQTAWKYSWNAIKFAALAVAQWFSGPFVHFFTDGWNTVYRNVIQPFVHFFTQTIPGAVTTARNGVVGGWNSLARGVSGAWNTVYRNVISPVINYFTVRIPAGARSLRDRVVGAWNAVVSGLRTAWNAVYRNVISPVINYFTVRIPTGARNLRDRVVGAWNSLYSGAAGVYRKIRDNVFSPIGRFFTKTIPGWASTMKGRVVGFFGDMRDGLGRAWSGIKDKAKTPINWVLKHVWNQGIVGVWKKITGWIGLGNKLKSVAMLASGGPMPVRPGIFSKPTAIVGEGNPNYPEYVIPTDPKYRGRARALHEAAGARLMAKGGILDPIKNVAKKVGSKVAGVASGMMDFFTDPTGMAKKLFKPVLGKLSHVTGSPWGNMAAQFPKMAVSKMISSVKDSIGSIGSMIGLGGGSGGAGVKRWTGVVQQALRMTGQPAGYTAMTLRRMNQESGGNPTVVNKWDSNWKAGYPSVGLMQVIRPTFQSNAGSMRKTGPFMYGVSVNPLANVYASMRYALRAYGSLPSAYNRAGGYRNGTAGTAGGMHMFGEAGPEAGFSPSGWRILNHRQTAKVAGGGNQVIERLVLENHGVLGSQHEVENWLVDSMDQLRRKGRIK